MLPLIPSPFLDLSLEIFWRSRALDVPSSKRLHNYGKSPFLVGKLTISMAMFNSYVKLPEGNPLFLNWPSGFDRKIHPWKIHEKSSASCPMAHVATSWAHLDNVKLSICGKQKSTVLVGYNPKNLEHQAKLYLPGDFNMFQFPQKHHASLDGHLRLRI